METLDSLYIGLRRLTAQHIIVLLHRCLLGTFIGVLPGIGPLAAISLLLPITYHIEPTAAIVMLAGVYYGAEYGGSTASILLNLPGTAANAVTCLDGHPMAKQGRAGVALFHDNHRFTLRRHGWCVCTDSVLTFDCRNRFEIWSGRILCPDGARVNLRLNIGIRIARQGPGHGGVWSFTRYHWH